MSEKKLRKLRVTRKLQIGETKIARLLGHCCNCGKKITLHNRTRINFYLAGNCCSEACADVAFQKHVFLNNLATSEEFKHDPYFLRLSMEQLREIKRRFERAHEFAVRLTLVFEAEDDGRKDIADIFREQTKGPWTEIPEDVEEEIRRKKI